MALTKQQAQLLKVMKEVKKLADMMGLVKPELNKPIKKPVALRDLSVRSFEALEVYKYYPKKVGRKNGLAKLIKLFNSDKEFPRVKDALVHYIEYVNDQNTRGFNLNFKNFDTWLNCWQDNIDPPDTLKRQKQREERHRKTQVKKREQKATSEPRANISTAEFDALRKSLIRPIN